MKFEVKVMVKEKVLDLDEDLFVLSLVKKGIKYEKESEKMSVNKKIFFFLGDDDDLFIVSMLVKKEIKIVVDSVVKKMVSF